MRVIIVGPSQCGKTTFAREQLMADTIDDNGVVDLAGRESWVVETQDLDCLSADVRALADIIFEHVSGTSHDFRKTWERPSA